MFSFTRARGTAITTMSGTVGVAVTVGVGLEAEQFGAVGIDRVDRAGIAMPQQRLVEAAAEFGLVLGRADDGDGARVEQVADTRHVIAFPSVQRPVGTVQAFASAAMAASSRRPHCSLKRWSEMAAMSGRLLMKPALSRMSAVFWTSSRGW